MEFENKAIPELNRKNLLSFTEIQKKVDIKMKLCYYETRNLKESFIEVFMEMSV